MLVRCLGFTMCGSFCVDFLFGYKTRWTIIKFQGLAKKKKGVLGFMVSHMLVTNVGPLACGKDESHHSCTRSML